MSGTSAGILAQGIWDKEVASTPESARSWLLPGFVACGNTTHKTVTPPSRYSGSGVAS
jgi:hypothetical protein